jgi:hypothetical protein
MGNYETWTLRYLPEKQTQNIQRRSEKCRVSETGEESECQDKCAICFVHVRLTLHYKFPPQNSQSHAVSSRFEKFERAHRFTKIKYFAAEVNFATS